MLNKDIKHVFGTDDVSIDLNTCSFPKTKIIIHQFCSDTMKGLSDKGTVYICIGSPLEPMHMSMPRKSSNSSQTSAD